MDCINPRRQRPPIGDDAEGWQIVCAYHAARLAGSQMSAADFARQWRLAAGKRDELIVNPEPAAAGDPAPEVQDADPPGE